MKVSVSLVVGNTDEYRIGFESIESGFLPSEVFDYLNHEGIEIVEVLLDRVQGSTKTDIGVLTEISNIIYRLFIENDNVILYFFCDDLNEIPSSQKIIEPQFYRSRLFTAMFQRYIRNKEMDNIENISICIDAMGRNEYLHFIVRSHHQKHISYIRENIERTYAK